VAHTHTHKLKSNVYNYVLSAALTNRYAREVLCVLVDYEVSAAVRVLCKNCNGHKIYVKMKL
jgi:hypothetical protein